MYISSTHTSHTSSIKSQKHKKNRQLNGKPKTADTKIWLCFERTRFEIQKPSCVSYDFMTNSFTKLNSRRKLSSLLNLVISRQRTGGRSGQVKRSVTHSLTRRVGPTQAPAPSFGNHGDAPPTGSEISEPPPARAPTHPRTDADAVPRRPIRGRPDTDGRDASRRRGGRRARRY
jgi:hypothetical protein